MDIATASLAPDSAFVMDREDVEAKNDDYKSSCESIRLAVVELNSGSMTSIDFIDSAKNEDELLIDVQEINSTVSITPTTTTTTITTTTTTTTTVTETGNNNYTVKMSKKREAFIIDDTENGHIRLVTDQISDQTVSTTLMDKCIPVEYTSSPIVDILASTAKDTHPKPPPNFKAGINRMKKSTAVQCDRRNTPPKNKCKSKYVEASSNYKDKNRNDSKNGIEKNSSITLLEQIVRTHPIWYLQHIGRSAATHLLRPMNAGAFIVRSSSKANAMALSIRLPPGLTSDIDHYLIESAGPDKSVRLESSPYSFRSLPLLIEHYCLNGEELQTNLILPAAILNCRTSMQLQSLALMGQDFWTSDLAKQGGSGNNSCTTRSAQTNHLTATELSSDFRYASKKRSSFTKHSVSGNSGTSRTTIAGSTTVCGDDGSSSAMISRRSPNEKRTNALTGGTFLDPGIVEASGRRCSPSSRTSPSGQNNSGAVSNSGAVASSTPTNSGVAGGRRSLLKQIFRSENSSNGPIIGDSNGGGTSIGCNNNNNKKRNNPGIELAQCHAFTPLEQRKITSSQSAFALSSPASSSLSTQCDYCPASVQQPSQLPPPPLSADAGSSLSKPNWFIGHLRQQHQHPTPALRTFKPGRSVDDNSGTAAAGTAGAQEGTRKFSGTNLHFSVNSKPAVKPKPFALRRERSDLTGGGGCAARIAAHHYTDYHQHHHRSPGAGGGGSGGAGCSVRRALVPPSACLDENILRKCLEELKRKRHEAAATAVAQEATDSRSRQQQKSQRNHSDEMINERNFGIVLRARSSEGFRTDQRRLSVPNLADLAHSPNGVSSGVVTTAKALTSKLGRNPGTGELQTINEGLVTPVVRRKQYLKDAHASNTANDCYSPGGSLLQKPSPPHKKLAKQTEQEPSRHDDIPNAVEHIFTRKFHSERHSKERVFTSGTDGNTNEPSQSSSSSLSATQPYVRSPSSAVKRGFSFGRNVCSPSGGNITNNSASNQQQRFTSSARNIFANKQTATVWSAVNSELKNRQKIAKVRPTPQAPVLKKSLTSVTISNSSHNKQQSSRAKMTTDSDNLALTNVFQSQPSSSSDGTLYSEQQNSTDETPNCTENINVTAEQLNTSEYAHLTECIDTSMKLDMDTTNGLSNQNQGAKDDDDDVSVAGTVFNEPWDSNVWENLLDLAHYVDEKPSTLTRHYETMNQTVLGEAIVEEGDDEVICSLEMSYDGAEEERSFQKSSQSTTINLDDNGSNDDYGIVIRRFDNHRLNDSAESDGRRNGMININAYLRSDESLSRQQQQHLEAVSKSSSCGSGGGGGGPEASNSMMNVSNVGEISDGTATMDSHKSVNTHSLPRILPRYSKLNDSWLESLDDIPTSIRALSPIISPPRLKNSLSADPGTKIQEYVERLSQEENTVFGATLRRFIECTFEAEECDPQVVIRNVRQFLNGLKNYLVKHGEGELHDLIEKERTRLNANEFLNIDAILEAILHKIVLCPVKPHLYHLMVREYSKNGWLQALSENLTYVRTLSPEQLGFGVRCKFIPPTTQKMETIKICLRKMQHHYSPLKKLENLLRVIFLAIGRQQPCDSPNGDLENYDPVSIENSKIKILPPADELVRWLVYLLARTSTVGCEVEAWYMWELLPKQLLTTGDSSYYLIALFSAIDVLKNTESIRKLGQVDDSSITEDGSYCSSVGSVSPVLSSSSDAFVKVAVPDELDGSIRYHTFPGVPQMTAGKLCRVIAHQFGVTNPEDHGLYLLVDGYETCLQTNECPDLIRHQLRQARKAHLFAYKRHEAKIAWPKFAMSSGS